MTRSRTTDIQWRILSNHEGRFSLMPLHHGLPAGWQQQGEPATKAECLQRIAELWTDMRPLSLREASA